MHAHEASRDLSRAQMEHSAKTPLAKGRVRGVGLSLRSKHYRSILESGADVPWFEILADNYAFGEGPPLHFLERIRERYPVVFHSVGMSLASTDPLNFEYLQKMKQLIERFQPEWVSDHLAWTSIDGRYFNELLPPPFTEESLNNIVSNIERVQDFLGQRILVENASAYLAFCSSTLSETQFIAEVVRRADCDLLLDVNNVYVNSQNFGFDPVIYLEAIPHSRVRQMHLAGYTDYGTYLLDSHGARVSEAVWALYEKAVALMPGVATCIEWDNEIPEFEVLFAEMARAQACWNRGESRVA